jgi:hypothetical protein
MNRLFYSLVSLVFVASMCTSGQVKPDMAGVTEVSSANQSHITDNPETDQGLKSQETLSAAPGSTLNLGPTIHSVETNASSYPDGIIPRHDKFEITFQIESVAQNLQMPYDAAPPAGIDPEIGITVNAQFSPDNWQTMFTQPAFYYQEFEDQVKSGQEWFYPTENYSWKVRFSPEDEGKWKFKLIAQDASGSVESSPMSFDVGPSTSKGFIRISQEDARYFQYENGSYFPGLGYNMNFDHVSWNNPILENEDNFEAMSENGIQLVRIWLSEWAIFDVYWNPWNSIDPDLHGGYFGYTGISFEEAYPGSDVSMKIDANYNPCMFIGAWKAPPAVKPHTTYRVRVRYKTKGISGPRLNGNPYGFTAKIGDWLWGSGSMCQDTGTGSVVIPYQSEDTTEWQIQEGSFSTDNYNFLPYFYLVMENVNEGTVYVDYVWIEEDLGNGNFGSNIVAKPWMAHHMYMEQRNSYAFDKVLALAEQYNIYIRPVIHEKNSWIFNRIDFEGNPVPDDPNNNWFYGNSREMTKVRWLQQAWWRYLQARWGYSTSIHSWELLNEGDPWNGLHYTLADEFGKYMHKFQPDDHLVSTSFWHSFPRDNFWDNQEYPHIDFADYHQYIPESDPLFYDTALANYTNSMDIGALTPGGAGKPTVWGEVGFTVSGSEPVTSLFDDDLEGIWLHNFVWANINPGGLLTSYWYENTHIYKMGSDGNLLFDHRDEYGAYYKFIKDIPLNNGHYQDSNTVVSNSDLRAWGQVDLVNQNAHLWIQNSHNTWRNVVDDVEISTISGTVTLSGFEAGEAYLVEWWDTYPSNQSRPILRVERLIPSGDGSLTLQVNNLIDDTAVKIFPEPVYDE